MRIIPAIFNATSNERATKQVKKGWKFKISLNNAFFRVFSSRIPGQTFTLITAEGEEIEEAKKAHYVIKIDLILLVSLVGISLDSTEYLPTLLPPLSSADSFSNL